MSATTLFVINKQNQTLLHPEAAKLSKVLRKLSSDDLKYIILAYDYNSKYRQFPLEDRKRKAEREVYGLKVQDVEVDRADLKDAIAEYQMLQYDIDRAFEDICLTKITDLQKKIIDMNSDTDIAKTLKAIGLLEKQMEAARQKYQSGIETMLLRGGKEPSFIEIWQKNARNKALQKQRDNAI